MFCLRCGTKIEKNQSICPHCGANIQEELSRYNYIPRQEQLEKKQITEKNSHDEQYQYSLNYSFGSEEDLIKTYVGKNYDKIKNTKFSLPTLFFGPVYFFYRKLYLLGILWIILLIMTIINPVFPAIAVIIFSTAFSHIYLNEVTKRVRIIKEKNKHQGKDAVLQICKKKGGVNKIIPLISILIIIILTTIAIYILDYIPSQKEKELETQKTYQLEDISYTIPKGFTPSSYNTEDYKNYTYMKNDDYCNITIEKEEYAYLYDDVEEYVKDRTYTSQNDIVSPIETITLNNKPWIHLSVTSDYEIKNIYAYDNNKVFYKIDTYSDTESSSCNEFYEKILNSITYKE